MPASTVAQPATVVLVRKNYNKTAAKHGWWVAIFVLSAMVALSWIMARLWIPEDVNIWERLWKPVTENPGKLLEGVLILIALIAHILMTYVQSKDKIVISAAGIAYTTSLPSWLSAIIQGWSIPWSRIKSAEIHLALGMHQPTLILNDGARRRKILVDAWVKSEDKPKQISSIWEMFRYQRTLRAAMFEEMKIRVEVSPLIQALRAHNVSINYPDAAGTGLMFDLQSQPRTNVAVAVFLGLLAYAFIDTLYLDEIYVGDYPSEIWAGVGLVSGLLAFRWIAGPKIPRIVSLGLATMIGFGVAVALYPGLLRLNQLTDSDGLVAHDYVLREYGRLAPMESGPPEVSFSRYHDYWSQFSLGSTHRLYLRHGGLGFYQLDEAPLLEAARAYYEKQNAETRKAK